MKTALDAFRDQVGYLLLTVTRVELPQRLTVRRAFSSHPSVYPLHASKAMDSSEWLSLVAQRLPVVCQQPAELQRLYPADAEVLQTLGCGSGINVPVFEADVLLGSVNAFHQAGWYTSERVVLAQQLATELFWTSS